VILPKTAAFWQEALAVVPVSDRLLISTAELDQRQYCGDSEFTLVPNDYLQYGMENTDLILFVSGSASERFCQSRTLAVAVACNFDQYDRPTAGAINVCLDNIILDSDGTATNSVVQDYVDVSIHEVGHVLGHSSNSYRFFYDPDTGTPRTSRPFSARTVTCVDGTERSQILPGPTTMTFGVRNDGATRYASIVTPKVRTVARNQFNCPSLEGAPLENQPTRADSCTGDHWDERLFYPEAMSGVISPTTNILSSLTLALMEDSGWYVANYTSSKMSPWGLGVGCAFVEQPCLIRQGSSTTTTTTTTTSAAAETEDGTSATETVLDSTGLSSLASSTNTEDAPALPDYSRGFFCNQDGDRGCSSELTHKLACSVIDYSFLVGQESPPVEAQFFDNSNLGGPRQADFCPVYGTTYDNKKADALDCRDPQNNPTGFVNSYEEVYGPDSRCLPSSSGEGRCYFSACVASDMTFRFIVGGKWYICEEDFQELSVSSFLEGVPHTVTCPRLAQACPDLFCPFNCAGRGICNYDNVVNGTNKPTCECFDSSDTSRACSESQIPDGGYLDDGSGLLDNLEENFFDPLVAVFVDHPDKWTTASWAWAAGLVSICIVLLLCICSSFWPQKGYSPYSKGEGLSSSHYRRP
jgi:Leishmanolysin